MSSFNAIKESISFLAGIDVDDDDLPELDDVICPHSCYLTPGTYIIRNNKTGLYFVLSKFGTVRGQTLRECGEGPIRFYTSLKGAKRSLDCWLAGRWLEDEVCDASTDYDSYTNIRYEEHRRGEDMEIVLIDFPSLKMEIVSE